MHDWPTKAREWSLAQKLDAIQTAGFDGVCAYVTPELKAGADQRGLVLMSGFDCSDLAVAKTRLVNQRDLGVRLINIQLLNHDTLPGPAVAMAIKLLNFSAKNDLAVHIEVHRDTATETPEKFTEIDRLFRRATGKTMPVTWDHSHFAVSKHVMPKDYSSRLLAWPKSIQHSQLFHLRPFSSQHCQVPVTNGKGRLTPEFRDYLAFVEDLFALWLSGPRPGNTLWTCPELGMTHGYHVSTNPHPWPDALAARKAYAGAWRRALKRVIGKAT